MSAKTLQTDPKLSPYDSGLAMAQALRDGKVTSRQLVELCQALTSEFAHDDRMVLVWFRQASNGHCEVSEQKKKTMIMRLHKTTTEWLG